MLVVIALCDMAGRNREEKKEELESEVKGMAKYSCGRPDWADEEDCPFETGEAYNCAECYWGKEEKEV